MGAPEKAHENGALSDQLNAPIKYIPVATRTVQSQDKRSVSKNIHLCTDMVDALMPCVCRECRPCDD